MIKMNKKEIIAEIKKLKALHLRNLRLYDRLSDIGFSPESPIYAVIDENFENYLRLVCAITGITKDALGWFVYENNCGDKGMVCAINEKEYKITGPKSFVEFEKGLV